MGGRVASPTFVGRFEELELLEAASRRAADAEPAVVLVGGEAGVGKTRLVGELTSRCAAKESNWIPTSADGGFEVLFRFYGPEKPLFDKTWRLPDIENVEA